MPDYKITVKGAEPIMVRALNPSAARNWAVRDSVTVEPLTTDDAIKMARNNQDIIDITKEPVEPEPQKHEGGEAGAGAGLSEVKEPGEPGEGEHEKSPADGCGEVDQSPKKK